MKLPLNLKSTKTWVIILLMAVTGVLYNKYYRHAGEGAMSAVLVKAISVQPANLSQDIHAVGSLTARSVQITPEISGHVDKILFKDGAEVKEGEVLVMLEDDVYRAQSSSAKARLQYSENNYKRMALLGKKGIVAQQAIDQADSDLKEKRAAAEESTVMLNRMKLTAPFAGIVGRSQVNPGDYVTVGKDVVTLTDVKHLRIEYTVPEKYLPSLKTGQSVTVTTSSYPGEKFIGKLSFISPTINTSNRSIAVYADIDNSNGKLAPGMYVDVSQSLGVTADALMIPARSVMPVLDGAQVYKVVDGKAEVVDVKIGARTPDDVQVTEGLKKGDVVITDGQFKIKSGMPVQIQS